MTLLLRCLPALAATPFCSRLQGLRLNAEYSPAVDVIGTAAADAEPLEPLVDQQGSALARSRLAS
jgi:hypothetical protein